MSAFRWCFGLLIVGVIVGGPAAYIAHRNAHFRSFRAVEPGVLYRSGQLSQSGLERVLHAYGIRTVITLRDPAASGKEPDWGEEEFCRQRDIRYVRITPRPWSSDDGGPAPVEAGIQTFLRTMDDRTSYPVLVHCFAGVHRTGAYVAVYRMEYEGWSNKRALNELRAGGYTNLDTEDDVRGFLENYRRRDPSVKK
jgi:protein tyrosine/serine phosphatase